MGDVVREAAMGWPGGQGREKRRLCGKDCKACECETESNVRRNY